MPTREPSFAVLSIKKHISKLRLKMNQYEDILFPEKDSHSKHETQSIRQYIYKD